MAPLLSCSSELRGSASSLMDLSEALLRPDTPLQDEPAFCMSPCDADDSVELAQLLARCEHDVFQCLPAFRWEESDVEGIGASLEPEAHDAAAVAGALAGCESSGILSQGSTKVARPPFSHRNGGPCDHCGVKESPQWRRGPSHKPVLCNACGTRYRRTNQLGPVTPRPGAPPRKRGLQNLSPLAEEPAAKGARLEAELGPGHHLVAAAVERA